MGDRHIFDVTRSIIGKYDITWAVAAPFGSESFSAQTLYEYCQLAVRGEVRKMRPETLGKIAVQGLSKDDPRTERQPRRSGVTNGGRTSLYAVHCGTYLNKHHSGRNILVELAVTAIFAEMTDQLRVKMERENAREPLTTEGM